MKKKDSNHVLSVAEQNKGDWFEKTIADERKVYEDSLKEGFKDNGLVWASLYLEVFFEGVFTQKVVPSALEVEVPNGLFRLTAMKKDNDIKWLVRNDLFGALAEVNPKDLFGWAIENYPKGIDMDGYSQLAHYLLSIGAKTDEDRKRVYDMTFYDEPKAA